MPTPLSWGARLARALVGYVRFARDWRAYRRLPGAEPLRIADMYPRLDDRTARTEFDPHYFYQGVWAAQRIAQRAVARHVDVGSDHRWAAQLTAFTKVVFVDIRPLVVTVDGFTSVSGDIVRLPFADQAIGSLSCLHVAEHVGLGRYGDALDPLGTRRAAAELLRVLAPGGDLYFSVPIGRKRVQFNAHRIHRPDEILAYFDGLALEEFSAVDDAGRLHRDAVLASFADARYACGLFWFRKRAVRP